MPCRSIDSNGTDKNAAPVVEELRSPPWALRQTRVRAPDGLVFLITTLDMRSRSRELADFLTKHREHVERSRYVTLVQNLTWERLLVRKQDTPRKAQSLEYHERMVQDISQGRVPLV